MSARDMIPLRKAAKFCGYSDPYHFLDYYVDPKGDRKDGKPKIPYTKPGRGYLFKLCDLEAFLESGRPPHRVPQSTKDLAADGRVGRHRRVRRHR